MLKFVGHMTPAIVRPFAATAGAAAIVFIGVSWSARGLPQLTAVRHDEQVEMVSMTKAIVMQPKLMVNVKAGTPQATPPAGDAVQIARMGDVHLLVANVDRAVASLHGLALAKSGDIFALDVSNENGSGAPANATLSVRIPARNFDALMAALSRVGNVRERSVSASDVTNEVTDSQARLRNLRRTEGDILRIMDRSGSVSQVMEAENQLSQVRESIETLESQLKSLHRQVVYSTISITMLAEASAAPVEPTPAAQLATALSAAEHSASQTAIGAIAALLWCLVYAPFVAVLALAVILAYRVAAARTRIAGTSPNSESSS